MPKATSPRGILSKIEQCYINIPGAKKIILNNLPDISDSKRAVYSHEGIIGRASPLVTYGYSDIRTVSLQLHFFVIEFNDIDRNLDSLRAIESALYPRSGNSEAPFEPPPICQIKCGDILAKEELCVILDSCQVRIPTDTVLDEATLCPYKFDVDTQWTVVYTSSDLPEQSRIYRSGR
jgi:hypothetical protein